ncbi:MAG: LacI family transcriptional regulator [Treponema sp.]|jgi:LacI family transcriptional regulator|nr:LacI family transcriptional regulator [Treponema sp.]
MKPTLRQIAQMLNISTATVSKALAGKPEVNDHTRSQVLSCAQKVGYSLNKTVPNETPRRERRGVIFIEEREKKENRNMFFYDVLVGFQRYAAQIPMETIVLPIDDVWRREPDSYDRYLNAKNIDGVLVSGLRKGDPYISRLETTKIPTVVLDYSINNPRVGQVGVDNIAAVRLAVDHLAALGHRKIGFLNGHSLAQVSGERLAGFAAALGCNNLPFGAELVFEGDFTEHCGAAAADYFAEAGLTAVFCASDLMAIGLIHHLHRKRLRIPEDISVVGFDNMPLSAFCTPRLTTVAQDRERLGVMACALLHTLMNNGPLNHCVLHPALLVRESTAPPPPGK